jgi:hypothetical protein
MDCVLLLLSFKVNHVLHQTMAGKKCGSRRMEMFFVPKDRGRSVMVSKFLCECHGRLRLTKEQQILHPDIPSEAGIMIKPGKGMMGIGITMTWLIKQQHDTVAFV